MHQLTIKYHFEHSNYDILLNHYKLFLHAHNLHHYYLPHLSDCKNLLNLLTHININPKLFASKLRIRVETHSQDTCHPQKGLNEKHFVTNGVIQARNQRGRGREVSPALFQKFEKNALICGKKCPDCGHLWVKFSFKMQFLSVSQQKNRRFLPCGAFLFCVVGGYLSKCPNSKKTPLPKKIPGYAPGYGIS